MKERETGWREGRKTEKDRGKLRKAKENII